MDPSDLVDLYWAGRTTLVSRHDDIARYDEVFRRFFLGAEGPDSEVMLMLRASLEARGAMAIPSVEPGEADQEEEAVLGWMASDVDTLKHKSFAACTPEELAALRRIMARIRLTPPRRRTRRSTAARSGTRPDPRRTVRESMRTHGEPARLYWRRRKVRLRPLILILDISGSMADYSRSVLQFAHFALQSMQLFSPHMRHNRRPHVPQCISQSLQTLWLPFGLPHSLSDAVCEPQFEHALTAPMFGIDAAAVSRSTKNSSRSIGTLSLFSSTHCAARPLSGLFVL